MKKITQAIWLAERAHRGQYRKPKQAGVPYIAHPIEVARMLATVGADETTIAAALLHDVLEDTGTAAEAISVVCGAETLALVRELTDIAGSKAERRAAQATRPYSQRAALVKIADKACNVFDFANWVRRDRSIAPVARQYLSDAHRVVDHCDKILRGSNVEIGLALLERFRIACDELAEALSIIPEWE